MSTEQLHGRINEALKLAITYGLVDGSHHKMWLIDQMVRVLTGCKVEMKTSMYEGDPFEYGELGESDEYEAFVAGTHSWDKGIAP